jgi:diaminopimelate epimerase
VERAQTGNADFRYRIFNADGGEVGQCGNGARCFARFVHEESLTAKDCVVVETASGLLTLNLLGDDQVRVDMGIPALEPANIPFDAPQRAVSYPLQVGDKSLWISALSMGNPHAVLLVEDVDNAPVASLGPLIERHPRFPQRVNAGFMQVLDSAHIRLRVFERGAGETTACGSGACAAVVAGRLRDLLEAQVRVTLPGGELVVSWAGEGSPVYLTGPATRVYEGQIEL